ncbi:MAG: hypothetical protein KDD41_01780 [Flavobacteriales bacterium]|nr:hypothetical protein [Flavobacteriales bacterium]
MGKLKTYWYNNRQGLLLQLTGFLFFFSFGVLALIFYKERTLSIDSAAFSVELIQNKTFFLPMGRWGSAFSQLLPLLFVKSGCSLATFLKVYSLNFVILYYIGFLFISLGLKNNKAALIYLLTLCLFSRYTFYFSVSEFAQGLALVVLFYALYEKLIDTENKKKYILLGVSLGLIYTLYYFHQLLIIPLTFVMAFAIIKARAYKNTLAWLPVLFGIAWFGMKILLLPKNSYESDKIPDWNVFKEQIGHLFEIKSFEYFRHYFVSEYLVVSIVFVICLLLLAYKRKWIQLVYIILAVSGYFVLIMITYYLGEAPNMYDQYYIVLGLFIAFTLVTALREYFRFQYVVLLAVPLMVFSIFRIYKAHEIPSKRISYLNKLCALGRQYDNKKYVIHPEDLNWGYMWTGWAVPVETMMLSSLDGGETVTFYVPTYDEKVYPVLPEGELHAAHWQKWWMNTKILDPLLFNLPDTTNYGFLARRKRDRYYFYERIYYDYKWKANIEDDAREKNISIEENLWRHADYMANEELAKQEKTPLEIRIMDIKNNPEWMALIEKKAEERGITVEEMIKIDAVYSLKEEQQ